MYINNIRFSSLTSYFFFNEQIYYKGEAHSPFCKGVALGSDSHLRYHLEYGSGFGCGGKGDGYGLYPSELIQYWK